MIRRMLLVTSVAIASMSAIAAAQPVPDNGGGNGNAQGGGGGGPGGGGGGPGGGGGGRGNFDPAQMRQRMMDQFKQQLGATDDEWAVLQPKIEAVMNAQRDSRAGGGGGGRGGFGGGGGPGGNGGGAFGGGRNGGGNGQDPNAPQSDLSKAATSLNETLQNQNASADDITAKLKTYRDARTAAEDKLKAAREDLKGVTNARQEAMLVLRGLLE